MEQEIPLEKCSKYI